MTARPPRGFALIIVVITGVAIVAMATAIVFTAGANKIVTTQGANVEHSQMIASAGLERATAYAKAVVRDERDFDLLLDPGLSVNCVSGAGGSDLGLPRYSDGSVATFAGRQYRAVAYSGGAYLTRFDDDADDTDVNDNLTPFTGNRAVNSCAEGPLSATPGLGAFNNPFRDRNRSVWVTVMGIFPGVDPNVSTYRTTLRRFYVATEPTPVPVVAVAGNLDAQNGRELTMCSRIGDVWANTADLGNQTRTCNLVSSRAGPTGPAPANPAVCAPITCTTSGTSALGPTVPIIAPAQPPPFDKRWLDTNKSCNFYIQRATHILYFWDSGGVRGGQPCNGPLPAGAIPTPSPASLAINGNYPTSCWVPLVEWNVAGGAVVSALAGDNVGVSWRPSTTSTVVAAGTTVAGTAIAVAVTKPDWSTCAGVGWRPPNGGGATKCTSCDGTNPVAQWSAAPGLQMDFSNRSAIPAGAYFFDQAVDMTTWNLAPVARTVGFPPDDSVAADWAMMSVFVNGAVTLGGSGALGIGARVNQMFPSLVATAVTVSGSATWALAGSTVTVNDFDIGGGNAKLWSYGLMRVGGDLTIAPSGALREFYADNLGGGADVTLLPVPAYAQTLP